MGLFFNVSETEKSKIEGPHLIKDFLLLFYLWKSMYLGKIEGKEDELMFFVITRINDTSANNLISALHQ